MAACPNGVVLDDSASKQNLEMKPSHNTWPQYLRNGFGLKLSRLGEVLGVDRWTYNPVILELFHSIALQNAEKVASAVLELFPQITSVVDVGSGSGAFAAELQRRGVRAVGLERSAHGRMLASQQSVECREFDVRTPCDRDLVHSFDLAYSFEVAEHLPPALADSFVSYMAQLSDLILFAAAQPGQGGIGHINEQPVSYWLAKFSVHGFRLDDVATQKIRTLFRDKGASDWFGNNACVLQRQ